MKKSIFCLITGTILAIYGCSNGTKKNATVMPIPPVIPTLLSDVIFKKSNGITDSFHISLQSVSNAFQVASSDSFTIKATNGSGTGGSTEIVSYIISGTSINTGFKGTNTIRVNWFENTSNQQYVASVYNIISDTTNHILGSFTFGISPASVNEQQKSDTIISMDPNDTVMCVYQTGTAIGTFPVDNISVWVLECTERIGPSQFSNYGDYFLLQQGVNVTAAKFYKNRVLTSSYVYSYVTDGNSRVIQKTITDNNGGINTITYKYK